MHRVTSKLQIIMILTIITIGLTVCSSERRTHHYRRTRHHRSNRSSNNNSEAAQQRNEFMRNLLLLRSPEWKCGTPRPRLVNITEALGEPVHIPPHMSWTVKVVVLHRCENQLGCCLHDKSCTAIDTENVTVTFQAKNKITDQTTYPQHQFINHTRCGCT